MRETDHITLEYRLPAQLVVVTLGPIRNSIKVQGEHGDALLLNSEIRHLLRIEHFVPLDQWSDLSQYYEDKLLDADLTRRLGGLIEESHRSGGSRFVQLRHGVSPAVVQQRAWDGAWHDYVESALQLA